jgi:hypothetical protein
MEESLMQTFAISFAREWVRRASVVWWTELLAAGPEVLSSIPAATIFSAEKWVWNGVHSASRG